MRAKLARFLIASLLALTWPRLALAQSISNPDLFRKSQTAAQQAIAYYGAWDNAAELERVAGLGYRIAQESKFQEFPFTFYLIDMPEPNAFALPGGQIFITRGMMNLGLNDDMLAGLLGHEIGHVVLEHGTRMQRRATLLNVLSQALLVGVMIGAANSGKDQRTGPYDPYARGSQSGDLVQGAAAAGAVVSELLLRSYSRGFEDEADDEGQRLAAAAGFSPDGTRQLMEKMGSQMPQSKEYGYWRTHPFFDERVQAASVRRGLLKVDEPRSAAEYRARTQATLLGFLEESELERELVASIKQEALVAWPQGDAADALRLEQLHALRDRESEKRPLSQRWADVIAEYRRHQEQVRLLTPDSSLLSTLEQEIGGFQDRLAAGFQQATAVFEGGIYETEFLETFVANYPEAAQIPEARLSLGEAYARLGRQDLAVENFLGVRDSDPESSAGQKALLGLRNLTPRLESLGALEQLALESPDSDLRKLAAERLDRLAGEYEKLANGADYLRRFPEGSQAAIITQRLNELADELYAELILYQSVGDHVKGIERIQEILTYAPNSPAAARLRETMVVES